MYLLFRPRKKKRIYVFYSYDLRNTGSTTMRGYQFSKMLESAFIDGGVEVIYTVLDMSVKKSTVLLTKGAIMTMSTDDILKLKQAGNYLYLDPVDMLIDNDKFSLADTLIAVAQTAYLEYSKLGISNRVVLVDHHVDPRIHSITPARKKLVRYRAGYFGLIANTLMSERIASLVDFVPVNTEFQDTSWLAKLPEYSLHYAIRNHDNKRPKPFLKGFTAAHSFANVIVDATQTEAIRWLGENYPYLVKEPVNEASVLSALVKARDSYGKSDWKHALEIMDDIRIKTSREEIIKQMKEAFSILA